MNPTLVFLLGALLAAVVVASPALTTTTPPPLDRETVAVLYKLDTRDDRGQFAYRYLLEDGTDVEEEGSLRRTADDTDDVLVKKGSYRYLSPEGEEVKASYVADEYGFRLVKN